MDKSISNLLSEPQLKYHQFSFRLSDKDLEEIHRLLKLIDKKLKLIAKKSDKRPPKKNKIIASVLINGLKKMNGKLPKLKSERDSGQ